MIPVQLDIWLPVCNAAATLPATLADLRRQTFADFRVIAVDDGSSDGSGAVLHAAAAADARIVVESRPHRGLIGALQRCAQLSTAPFVARADADDRYHPRRLEQQLARLLAEDAPGLVGAGVAQFPASRRGPGMRAYTAWVNRLTEHAELMRDRLVECPIVHTTFCFRRAVYDAAGGYRTTPGPEDLDLLLRMVEQGARLAAVPKVLAAWRLRADSLQRTDARYGTAGFLQVKLGHLRRLGLLDGRPVVLWGQTWAGKWMAQALTAANVRVTDFVDCDPRKIGKYPYGIPVRDDAVYVPARGALHLGLVRQAPAREKIRRRLNAAGLREWQDFVIMQ